MNEWVSVNIKPPQDAAYYLVFITGAKQPFAIGYYLDGSFYRSGGYNWADYKLYATHYQMLPEPPKH